MSEIFNLIDEARVHADRLMADIILCKTREEHIRVTARANEAAAIVAMLNKLIHGGEDNV